MDRSERFAIIERLLRARRTVSFEELRERLEVSRPTLYRDLAYLRDRMGVPVIRDEASGNLSLDQSADRHELPGLWFNAEEIHALLTMQQLLANLDPGGLLGPHIEPLKERLTKLLETGDHPAAESWHPGQEGRFLEDGSYELRIPYSNDPELVMDILKYGPDCGGLGPGELRGKVKILLSEALVGYGE